MAVLLYAGVTTLTAALVTLFTAGMAAGNMERRGRKRRCQPLEATATRRQPEVPRTERPLEGSRTKQASKGATAGKPSPPPPEVAPASAPDAMPDLERLLQELEMPTGGLVAHAPPEDGGSTLDIFAGMGEPEMAAAGLKNDLDGIDGGGLLSSSPRPQVHPEAPSLAPRPRDRNPCPATSCTRRCVSGAPCRPPSTRSPSPWSRGSG